MPIITVVVTIIVVGVLLYVINSLIPMEATVKKILNVVVILALIVWLLKVFGVLDPLWRTQI